MLIDAHINEYSEPRVVLNSTGSFAVLLKGIEGVLSIVFFIPIIAVFLIYYPFIIFSLQLLVSRSKKLVLITEKECKDLKFEEAKIFHSKIEFTLHKLNQISADGGNIWLFKPILSRTHQIIESLIKVEKMIRSLLYVDTSDANYTDSEKQIFSDLKDFFGKDEDEKYQKDTFDQLKLNRENL